MNLDTSTIIPTVPTLLLVLVNFFTPYVVSFVSAPFWPKTTKKFVAIGVSLVLTGLVIALAHFGFAFAIPAWPQLLILGVLVSQTVYSTLLKDTADTLSKQSGIGSKQTVVTTAVEKSVQVIPAAGSTVVVNSLAPVADPAAPTS